MTMANDTSNYIYYDSQWYIYGLWSMISELDCKIYDQERFLATKKVAEITLHSAS